MSEQIWGTTMANFEKRLSDLEQSSDRRTDIRSCSDEELWAMLPAWWQTVPADVFEELALLDRTTEAGRQRYRVLKRLYGGQ